MYRADRHGDRSREPAGRRPERRVVTPPAPRAPGRGHRQMARGETPVARRSSRPAPRGRSRDVFTGSPTSTALRIPNPSAIIIGEQGRRLRQRPEEPHLRGPARPASSRRLRAHPAGTARAGARPIANKAGVFATSRAPRTSPPPTRAAACHPRRRPLSPYVPRHLHEARLPAGRSTRSRLHRRRRSRRAGRHHDLDSPRAPHDHHRPGESRRASARRPTTSRRRPSPSTSRFPRAPKRRSTWRFPTTGAGLAPGVAASLAVGLRAFLQSRTFT
jgi:hypothetical protein